MADTLAPGSLLINRYEILDLAGSGGMGAVYKAADRRLGTRLLAVKEMSEEGLSPQEVAEATAAFQQEAVLLGTLRHPSLPKIYDYFTTNGRWYLVMEFIEGTTLEQHLLQHGTPGLPVDEVLRLADHLCGVLDYLHIHVPPIIFRDLKPSNVMVTPDGEVYLIDFGIARLFKPGKARDTIAIGTVGYAAPEQLGTAQTTAQSDIFSFGATLHQLLTGVDPSDKPFTFPPIRPMNPATPPGLEALIMRMVQMDDIRRPPSIAVVQQELDQIASQMSAPQPPALRQEHHAFGADVAQTLASTPYPNPAPTNRRTGRRVITITVIGTGLVALCIVALVCSASVGALQNLTQSVSSGAAQSQDTADAQSTLSANQSIWSSDENTLSSDENSLSYDVSTLVQDANFTDDLAAYASDWKQIQQDYSQEQSDFQLGCSLTGNAETVTLDAQTISLDLSSIHYDDTSLTYTIKSLNTDIQQVQSDIATVQSDLHLLEYDAAGSTGDTLVTTSESAANSALASAQQQVTAANKAMQSAQSQAKQYDQEAAQANTNAHNLANSLHC